MSSSKARIAGVGIIPFAKPGTSETYDVMGACAARLALADANVDYAAVQQAYVGYVYGDSTCGQRALYKLGMTGIPVINTNNNCSSGSTALFLGWQAVTSGMADCVLVLGFEQMKPGAIDIQFTDRPSPFGDFEAVADEVLGDELVGMESLPLALRYFGGAGLSHMKKYGTPLEAFASIRAKSSRHAARNPYAVFRNEITAQDVLQSPMLWPGVLTRLMACPPTCGAAAAVLVSPRYARRHGLKAQVEISALAMTSDFGSTFAARDMMQLVGFDLSRAAARQAYEAAGVGPEDVDVIELHDCFAQNELISYEALDLCGDGEAARLIADADNTFGGKYVTNPSGGLLSKGHPLGATGLAQCFELTSQLRASAGERQVEGARLGLQHNLGLGGACVVALYQRVSV